LEEAAIETIIHRKTSPRLCSFQAPARAYLPRYFPSLNQLSGRREFYPRMKLPHSVFYDWKRQWEKDRDWPPWNTQLHGEANRTFRDAQESALEAIIPSESFGPGKRFVACTFRELAQ
jgi:hypothetical protein